MNAVLRAAYTAERIAAQRGISRGDSASAFRHLERAHVLGQRDTYEHVRVHWEMLRLGLATRDWREVRGQAARVVAAALFTRIWVPRGNTGRANVGAMTPMEVPEDLAAFLGESRAQARIVPRP